MAAPDFIEFVVIVSDPSPQLARRCTVRITLSNVESAQGSEFGGPPDHAVRRYYSPEAADDEQRARLIEVLLR
jgi:hypothetical protein